MKHCVPWDWHSVWCLAVSIKCSLNTIELKQALHYCCELAKRWKGCYAFSNSTDPKPKLFSSKSLLLMFFTSHLVAQFRNLEAVQETSILCPPPVHAQTHLRSHQVMQIPSHWHCLDPAHSVCHHLCCAPQASLLLPSTTAPHLSPCLQSCFFMYLLQSDHLPMQTGHLLCWKLENLSWASGIRFKFISSALSLLMRPSW